MPEQRQTVDPTGKRKSPWIRAAVWLGGIALVLLLPIIILDIIGSSALREEVDAIRARGEPVTLEQLGEYMPGVPDEENLAVAISPLVDELLRARSQYRANKELPVLGKAELPDPGEAYPKEVAQALRQFAREEQELIGSVERLAGLEHAAVPVARLLDSVNDVLSPIRIAARVTTLRALAKLSEGRTDAALRDAVTLSGFGEAVEDFPSIIGGLVSASLDAMAVNLAERALSAGVCSEGVLEGAQSHLGAAAEERDLRLAMLGERAFQFHYLAGRGTKHEADLRVGAASHSWFVQGWFRLQAAKMLRLTSPLVGPHDNFANALAEARACDQQVSQTSVLNAGVRTVAASLSRPFMLHGRRLAELRSASAGLAAERFRLDHQRWPEGLEELVPEYLGAVPIDPFTNEPLIYLRTDSGVVIYSVGEDETDDGGYIHRTSKNDRAADTGFMLLDEGQRGFEIEDAADEDSDADDPDAEAFIPGPE